MIRSYIPIEYNYTTGISSGFFRAFSKMLYPEGHKNLFSFSKSFLLECHVQSIPTIRLLS